MIYAFGDIHGRFDLMQQALKLVEDYIKNTKDDSVVLVFLGDYVDRGPDSRRVMEKLIELGDVHNSFFVLGNHELMMMDAMDGGDMNLWLMNGGTQTIASYGGDEELMRDHAEWLGNYGRAWWRTKNHIFVHAGVEPGIEPGVSDLETVVWIREKFLRHDKPHELHVVHGHTPYWDGKKNPKEVELLPHRTNLDTAAFATGVLSVGVFDPEKREPIAILQTGE